MLIHSALARRTLCHCLARQSDIVLVELGAGSCFTQSDVVLIHYRLPPSLRDPLIALGRYHDAARLVLLGAPSDPLQLAGLLRQGVDGYVISGEPYEVLLDIVRRVASGEVRLDAAVLSIMLKELRSSSARPASRAAQRL